MGAVRMAVWKLHVLPGPYLSFKFVGTGAVGDLIGRPLTGHWDPRAPRAGRMGGLTARQLGRRRGGAFSPFTQGQQTLPVQASQWELEGGEGRSVPLPTSTQGRGRAAGREISRCPAWRLRRQPARELAAARRERGRRIRPGAVGRGSGRSEGSWRVRPRA